MGGGYRALFSFPLCIFPYSGDGFSSFDYFSPFCLLLINVVVLKYLDHKDRLETFEKVKECEVNQSHLDSTTYSHILGTIFIRDLHVQRQQIW